MCYIQIIAAVVAAVSSIANNIAANKAVDAQTKALTKQRNMRSQEIADQQDKQLNERARAARKERSAARASASESGINLSSNSFMAMLQDSEIQQSMDSATIVKDTNNRQRALQADYAAAISKFQKKTPLGIMHESNVAAFQAFMSSGGSMGGGSGGGMGGMGMGGGAGGGAPAAG